MRNLTLNDITVGEWAECTKGNFGKFSEDEWFHFQDLYIELFGGDSSEIKMYKRVCWNYYCALKKWVKNPKLIGKEYTEVNYLYSEKENLKEKIFNSNFDFDDLIAKITISLKFRIDKKKMTALEFFKLVKELGNGNKSD